MWEINQWKESFLPEGNINKFTNEIIISTDATIVWFIQTHQLHPHFITFISISNWCAITNANYSQIQFTINFAHDIIILSQNVGLPRIYFIAFAIHSFTHPPPLVQPAISRDSGFRGLWRVGEKLGVEWRFAKAQGDKLKNFHHNHPGWLF